MKHDWEYKKLGDICDVLDAQRKPVSKAERKNGIYPYYGASGIQDYVDSYIFDGRYLLVGEDGAKWTSNERSAYIVSGKCWVNNHAHILQMKNDILDSFVEFYLCHQDLSSYITGAVVPKLTQQALKSITIPVPPLSTQQSIVSELDSLSKIIADCKETLKDYDALEHSIFYDMFGDPVKNEKGWEVKELKSICREIGDGLHGTPEYSDNSNLYFVNGNNLNDGIIDIKENTKSVTETAYKQHYIDLDEKTLLISINGTLGKVAFYRNEKIILGKSACYLKVGNDIDIIFLYRLLSSEYFKNYMESECTGTTIRNVSLKSMRTYNCPLPPLPLQQQFASKIEAIEQMKSETKKALQEAETLFNARMDYWFN